MGMESILSLLSGAGLGSSPNMPLSPTSPTLNELTLNPSVLPGGMPPQVPYAQGMGPNLLRTGPTSPMAPGAGGPTEGTAAPGGAPAEGGGVTEGIQAFGDALKKFGAFHGSMQKSPLAQQMFQEAQSGQNNADAMRKGKMAQFRRQDLSSQILEKYGLL